MSEYKVDEVTLQCVEGNIAFQPDIEVVVNAANAELMPGGGVAGAIHRAAGEALAEECRPLAPIAPGEAVITGAHALPNSWIIHCLGPVYGRDEPGNELLSACYRNAMLIADKRRVRSIAFPALSTGAFGYPMDEAAAVAFATLMGVIPRLAYVRLIRFVLFNSKDRDLHDEVIKRVI